jgi:hypothetical protein
MPTYADDDTASAPNHSKKWSTLAARHRCNFPETTATRLSVSFSWHLTTIATEAGAGWAPMANRARKFRVQVCVTSVGGHVQPLAGARGLHNVCHGYVIYSSANDNIFHLEQSMGLAHQWILTPDVCAQLFGSSRWGTPRVLLHCKHVLLHYVSGSNRSQDTEQEPGTIINHTLGAQERKPNVQ